MAAITAEVPLQSAKENERFANTRSQIHTMADDPNGSAYGIWASGENYKASFHDGFTFVPYLGGGYPHNQPLSWRTTDVTVGGRSITDATQQDHEHSEFIYEYSSPGVIERYEVRAEGVEQTFTIASDPKLAGDLVVVGAVTTQLLAEAVDRRHGEITFYDKEGAAIAHYGAATAFDASGRHTVVETSWDGQAISLTVPGSWLAKATYPVTIDPLLSRNLFAWWGTSTHGQLGTTAIGRDDRNKSNNVMIAFTRRASATDFDMWVWLCSDKLDKASRHLVFADLTATWSTRSPAIAFVSAADKWITSFTRFLNTGGSSIRYHLHDGMDTALSSSVSGVFGPMFSHDDHSDVGGSLGLVGGNNALLVFDRDQGSVTTPNTEVYGMLIDVATNTKGAAFTVSPTPVGSTFDREYPSVNQVSANNSDGWFVVWQEYDNHAAASSEDWDVFGRRILANGTRKSGRYLSEMAATVQRHQLRPQVEGLDGRYTVAYATADLASVGYKTGLPQGKALRVDRVDWHSTRSLPTLVESRELMRAADRRWVVGGLAFDGNSDTFWGFTYSSLVSGIAYFSRLSYDCAVVEMQVLHSKSPAKAFATAVTFNQDSNQFLCTLATNEGGRSSHPVHTVVIGMPKNQVTVYGSSCGGTIYSDGLALTGSDNFTVGLSGAQPGVPSWLLISLAPATVDLSVIGLPSCSLLVSSGPSYITALSLQTNGSGAAAMTIPIPASPQVTGSIYFQWAHSEPSANSLGIVTSQGLHAKIVAF